MTRMYGWKPTLPDGRSLVDFSKWADPQPGDLRRSDHDINYDNPLTMPSRNGDGIMCVHLLRGYDRFAVGSRLLAVSWESVDEIARDDLFVRVAGRVRVEQVWEQTA